MTTLSTKLSQRKNFLFRKSIPPYATILLLVVTGVIVYFFSHKPPKIVVVNSNTNCPEKMDQVRLKDYKFTHPLLFADLPNETSQLSGLKDKVTDLIAQLKSMNLATDVSVYFRKMDDGSWFVINGSKVYTPASLMKIPFLIAILRQAASDPGFLSKKIYFEKHFTNGYRQNIKSFSLKEKEYYKIKDLLHDMIAYSDNDALTLIANNTNATIYNKIFTDLGVSPPALDSTNGPGYVISITDYCKLFRILYNGGYLTDEYSELALSLLSQSSYKNGLLKDLNPDFPVSHKFGERVDGSTAQLHEVGIFYTEPQPYLLGVMSVGHDLNQLSEVLNQISKLVYQNYNKGS